LASLAKLSPPKNGQQRESGFLTSLRAELEREKEAEQVIDVKILSMSIKGRVHCFSMHVVINKCFLLISEKKIGADTSCRFQEKRKKRTL